MSTPKNLDENIHEDELFPSIPPPPKNKIVIQAGNIIACGVVGATVGTGFDLFTRQSMNAASLIRSAAHGGLWCASFAVISNVTDIMFPKRSRRCRDGISGLTWGMLLYNGTEHNVSWSTRSMGTLKWGFGGSAFIIGFNEVFNLMKITR